MSRYGHWTTRYALPAFLSEERGALREEQPHCVLLGNRRIKLCALADGTVGLFDEGYGLRWLTAPTPEGTGISLIEESDGSRWGTTRALMPPGEPLTRTFGPIWFELRGSHHDLLLERTLLCPEGEIPWLLIRVRLINTSASMRELRHIEQWAIRPLYLNLLGTDESRQATARAMIRYQLEQSAQGYCINEVRMPVEEAKKTSPLNTSVENLGEVSTLLRELNLENLGSLDPATLFAPLFGSPAVLTFEALGKTDNASVCISDGAQHPLLEIHTPLTLQGNETHELWFRFGLDDARVVSNPETIFQLSLQGLGERLPRAAAVQAPQAEREIPWHAALLTGGACRDEVIGAHTLNQGSAYAFSMGFNGAARDPLQHALPLVYSEPDLALSVLRNTCAWATPDGDLPYGLDGAKRPWTALWQPSGQNLWALWLAAEYAAATGDFAAFDLPLAYHAIYQTPAVPLREHLRRQFRFFVDQVGRGERGHVRMRNADWNDMAIVEAGVERHVMVAVGESVLNSALASWVLGVFAGLCRKLGEPELADQSNAQADELRRAVASAWNGRWFDRAYAPGKKPIGGPDDCWLEVQPWSILCGAANEGQARALLKAINEGPRAGSPLGARLRWPVPQRDERLRGEGTAGGGVWFAINMALTWALARFDETLAWDEWRRMTLAAHTANYPDIWEGTLSGPDTYNAPESLRPGHTWPGMQAFPVNNLHSHAQPLLAYLRLLGVEPTARGTLAIGSGGSYTSKILQLQADGHGSLYAHGPVTLETRYGIVSGGPGVITW